MAANFISGFWEIFKEIWGWFSFVQIVAPWNGGIQVRMGNFVRVVHGGWWLKWPCSIDQIYLINVRPKALELDEQALQTLDNMDVVVKGVCIWSIFDVKKAFLDVDDVEDTLDDIALGIITEVVENQDWDYLRSEECRKEIKRAIQRQARKWGVSISSFKWQSIVMARTFKFFGCCE